jgi:hypothetical protein
MWLRSEASYSICYLLPGGVTLLTRPRDVAILRVMTLPSLCLLGSRALDMYGVLLPVMMSMSRAFA